MNELLYTALVVSYGNTFRMEHNGCMVDILMKAGKLLEAEFMVMSYCCQYFYLWILEDE